MPTLSRRLKDLRYHIFRGLLLNRGFKLVTLCGPNSICPWTICPDGLGVGSIVYSGGIGSDITFEHELVNRFGCQVFLFDPSPTGLQTMGLPENKIPQFRYFPVALARHPGKLSFSLVDPKGDSWFASKDSGAKVEVPCMDVTSLMAQNGHGHIDLIKLDIEGSEYEVIEDILERRAVIRQVCVEFHDGIIPAVRRSQTVLSILKLIARGYKFVNQEGANYTFIRG